MTISIHQPYYLPWLGYFDKLARSDYFVFLDIVQFQKNGFTNRNQIKTPQGAIWLTVPISTKDHLKNTIEHLTIADDKWQKKHWRSIELNYAKSPHLKGYYDGLKYFYDKQWKLFGDLCWEMLNFWKEKLKIQTKLIKASELDVTGKKDKLILDICKKMKATRYLSGSFGREYLDTNEFEKNDVDVKFQSYSYCQYPQLFGDFIPNMSIVDTVCNVKNPLELILKGATYD